MNILIEESPDRKRYSINVVPTTEQDIKEGQPSPIRLARIFSGLARDLLTEADDRPQGRVQLPPGLTIASPQSLGDT